MEIKKQINLLSNEPCREDAFEGHSHQNIAAQIARLIREDKKRHIIGVEGGWGSGKSNLIALVNKGLNGDNVYDEGYIHNNSPFPFFVYDAWGHQADFQRRAILEELTRELTKEKKILDGKKWDRKLEELLAKRKKTTTKEIPHMGIGLIISIILCALTPLITYLVNLVPLDKWWWRLLIAAVPYAIGILYGVFNRICSLKKNGQECSIANICSELILVYKDKIKENETYTTISEKEPSSSEFKAWMDEVDKDLKKLNKTLVIVFDNMDRLPSQKVESLWSSIHSFFSDKTYDNIRVLIPFDRQHVKLAFKNEDEDGDGDGESFGNDFINKTFDVVFRVPPPIMSGWQHYMEDMWKRAFGESAELSIPVTQIYDALSKNHTPRKIIAFVNEMATVKMTLGNDVPDKYIALFIFGKEKIEKDPIGQLLNPDFMGDVKFEYENDPDTIKYLSAIFYQLPADNALDVVFTKEATDALNGGNANRLHEMMERIDLPPILGKAILKVTEIEKATAALDELDSFYGYSDFSQLPSWLKQIWESLYQKCLSTNVAWDEIKEFHVQLFTHLYDESLAENLISGYLGISDEKWNVEQYVEAIARLRENNEIIDRKLEKYKRVVSPVLFLDLLRYVGKDYGRYGVDVDLNELDVYLASLEQRDVVNIKELSFIDFDKEKDFPQFKAQLQEWISEANRIEISDIIKLFSRLKEVSEKPLNFEGFFNDATLYNVWNGLVGKDNPFIYDLLSMRVARRDNMSNSFAIAFKDILENNGDKKTEALANVIEYYLDYGDLLLHSHYYKDYPLVVSVVKKLTDYNGEDSRMDVMGSLVHFDQICSDYHMDEMLLFNRINDWVENIDFAETKVDKMPSGLLKISKESENKLAKAIHLACEDYYSAQTQDQWKDHILKKDNTYRIWTIYHPKKYQANFDALKALLKDYANGTITIQPDKTIIDEWIAICLELKHSVKGLFNDISSILKRGLINKAKLLFFGRYILDYADTDKQNDFIVKLVPTEIIDADVIGFVADNIDKLKGCEIPDEFKEKVKHLAQTSMKDDERITTVCQIVGVEPNKEIEETIK